MHQVKKELDEINQARKRIKNGLEYLSKATNNPNHRKAKKKLLDQLATLDEEAENILKTKIQIGKISVEEYPIDNVKRFTNEKGQTYYSTWYTPLNNDPAVYIGNEKTLQEFNVFPKTMPIREIRKILCKEQRINDKITKEEEEEEEYEEIIIPKTPKKHK